MTMNLSRTLKKLTRPVKSWKARPELLLCPNIPKPMHGMAPRVVMGSKWWNKTRDAAYRSTLFCCLACATSKHEVKGKRWLEGHELYTVDYKLGQMTYVETVPLCQYCHMYIHDGRMRAMVLKRELTQKKFITVIQHGDAILAQANLKRLTHNEREAEIASKMLDGDVAAWKDWRLVFDGKEYKPKFKSPEHWKAAMK